MRGGGDMVCGNKIMQVDGLCLRWMTSSVWALERKIPAAWMVARAMGRPHGPVTVGIQKHSTRMGTGLPGRRTAVMGLSAHAVCGSGAGPAPRLDVGDGGAAAAAGDAAVPLEDTK
jgi:hypothetical protein